MVSRADLKRKLIPFLVCLLLITTACNLPLSNLIKGIGDNSPAEEAGEPMIIIVEGDNQVSGTAAPDAPKEDVEISMEQGTTRANPYPLGTMVSLPGWDIKVIEFLRGEEALQIIESDGRKFTPLSAGEEFALAKVYLRCTAMDEKAHSLGISEISITGSGNIKFGDRLDGWPAPEFLFEDMFTAEQVEGWIDAVIPADESDLMLVVDVNSYEEEDWILRYFALEEGASITLPTDFLELQPNGLGSTFDAPAMANQEVIIQDWAITLLDSIRGEEAKEILGKADVPNPTVEYLLVKVRVRYFNNDELPVFIQSSDFSVLDRSGNEYEMDRYTRPKFSEAKEDIIWIWGTYLPGADVIGWTPVTVPLDDERPLICFRSNKGDRMYFALDQ